MKHREDCIRKTMMKSGLRKRYVPKFLMLLYFQIWLRVEFQIISVPLKVHVYHDPEPLLLFWGFGNK